MSAGRAVPWPEVPLGLVCEVGAGNPAPEEQHLSEDGDVPFVRMQDVGRNSEMYLAETVDRIAATTAESLRLKLWPRGALLAPKSGASVLLDHRSLLDQPSYVVSHLAVVVPKPIIFPEYLYFWSRQFSFSRLVNDAGFPSVRVTDIARVPIPVPPLSEQQQIVEVLREVEEIRRLRAEAERKTAELIPALFHEMFGDPFSNSRQWPTDTIRSLAERISDGPFGSNLKSSHYTESGVRVVRLQNIGVGEFLDNDKAFVSEAHFEKLAKHECVTGDVLIGTLGDPNLRACLLPAFVGRALNKADCVQLRANTTRVTAEYVCWLLNMPGTLRLAASQIAGQGRFRISMGRLAEVEVPVPPLLLQERFSAIVREAMSMRDEIISSSEQSKSLRASLLARAFTGELTAEWRKKNADDLRPEAKERDEALAAAGVPAYRRSTIQEERDMWADPTAGSYAELSDEQARLFHDLKRYFNYPSNTGLFSAEAVADQLGDVFGISTDAVRRHLDVFAARGLLLRVTRERPAAESPEFAVLYRHPHLPGDDSEDDDDRRPAELLKLAAKVAPKFRRVAEEPETEATE